MGIDPPIAAFAPETLYERIVDKVARARGGFYLSVRWNRGVDFSVRDAVAAQLLADGWLTVAADDDALTFYGADAGIDAVALRAMPVRMKDDSVCSLAELASLDVRSAAPASSRSERAQRSIRGNLASILATQGLGLARDLARWPQVAGSVVNFGVELPVGASASAQTLRQYERAVTEAIRRFEPRLAPRSVSVQVVEPETALARGVLQMRIAATTRPLHGDIGIRIRTAIDLQTGRATTQEETAHAG